MPIPDPDIVRELRSDRTVGAQELSSAHANRLYSYAVTLLRDEDLAGEATERALTQVVGNVGKLRDTKKFFPWLFAITRNESISSMVKHNRWNVDEAAMDLSSIGANAAPEVGSPEATVLVRDTMAALSADDRDTLALALRDDLDDDDVALAMGISPRQARAKISKARSALTAGVAALVLAMGQRGICSGLDQELAGFDGLLSPEMRQQVTRHVETCAQCSERGQDWAVAGVAAFTLPVGLVPPNGFEDRLAAAIDSMNSSGVTLGIGAVNSSGFPLPVVIAAASAAAAGVERPTTESEETVELRGLVDTTAPMVPVDVPDVEPPAPEEPAPEEPVVVETVVVAAAPAETVVVAPVPEEPVAIESIPAEPVPVDDKGKSDRKAWMWVAAVAAALVLLVAVVAFIRASSGNRPPAFLPTSPSPTESSPGPTQTLPPAPPVPRPTPTPTPPRPTPTPTPPPPTPTPTPTPPPPTPTPTPPPPTPTPTST